MASAPPGSGSLQGTVALVTGAGSGAGLGGGGEAGPGIGAIIARCLAEAGASVALNDLAAGTIQATLADFPGPGVAVVGDISDPEAAAAIVRDTVAHFGRLDILVNSAGVSGARLAVERLPVDTWLRVMAVNLNGPFFMCRSAVPVMRQQGFGRIVNVSSAAGGLRISNSGGADYTTSKTGLLGLTRHLAAEVAPYGITVNAVCPGTVLRPARKRDMTPDELAQAGRRAPVGRLADPEDVGWTVAFLASRQAGYITGQAIAIDGGATVLPGDFSAYRGAGRKDYG